MTNRFCAVVLIASVCALPTSKVNIGLGDGLWRTFSKALTGDAPALPLTIADAEASGWVKAADFNPALGSLYSHLPSGGEKGHPLSLYFSAAGQVCGAQADVWGTSKVGPAAQPELLTRGFFKVFNDTADKWSISVSFRSSEAIISPEISPFPVGDRLVINQDTIAFALPLTRDDAKAAKYQAGSCMKTMGQHYFLDLEQAPKMTWKSHSLLPVVPMYNQAGALITFFFATPVVQPGSYLLSKADWETPFLPAKAMCQNWCNSECTWDTGAWSTMHIYLDSSWRTETCVGGSGFVGRSCPEGEI